MAVDDRYGTQLQRNLAGIQGVKIDPAMLQGTRYQAQAQQAQQVEQTNYSGALVGLMKAATNTVNTHVAMEMDEANKAYDEAKAQGLDPIDYAQRKAKEESGGLIGNVLYNLQEKVGMDPVKYSRRVTAARETEAQMFDIDNEMQTRIQRGDFKTQEEMMEARNQLRKASIQKVAEGVGVSSDDRFVLAGASKLNERSTQALSVQQAQATEAQLVATNKRTMATETKGLLDSGQATPETVQAMHQKWLADGLLRNDEEARGALGQVINEVAQSGNPTLTDQLLDTEVTVDGKKVKFGDTIDSGLRDQIKGIADQQLLVKNEAVYDQYQALKESAAAKQATGDYAGALADIAKSRQMMRELQGTDTITAEVRSLDDQRSSLKAQQARRNQLESIRREEQKAQLVEDAEADDLITKKQNGEAISFDYTDKKDRDSMDRAFTRRANRIKNDPNMTVEQKQDSLLQLAATAPKYTQFKKDFDTIGDDANRDLSSAIIQTQTGNRPEAPPPKFQQMVAMYKRNPELVRAALGPDNYATFVANQQQVESLGWDTFTAAKAGEANMKGTHEEKQYNQIMSDRSGTLGYNTNQRKELDSRARGYMLQTGGDVKKAIEFAEKDMERQVVRVDNAPLSKAVLAPNGDASKIPNVTSQLDTELATFKKNNPEHLFSISESPDGQIVVTNHSMGNATARYTSTELNLKYEDAQLKAYDERKAKDAKKIQEDNEMRKKTAEARDKTLGRTEEDNQYMNGLSERSKAKDGKRLGTMFEALGDVLTKPRGNK